MPDCRRYVTQEDCGPGYVVTNWDSPLDSLPTGTEFAKAKTTHRGRPKMRGPDGEFLRAEHGWAWGEEGDFESGWITFPPDHGFVAGCIWGDDSSWKIQYLDLRRIEEGVFRRDERFGYIALPKSVRLRDAIHVSGLPNKPRVELAVSTDWDLDTGNMKPIGTAPWNEE